MVGDLGERALAFPAGARLRFQSRREAVGGRDDGFAGVSFDRHWSLPPLGFRNMLFEKEEATVILITRNTGLELAVARRPLVSDPPSALFVTLVRHRSLHC